MRIGLNVGGQRSGIGAIREAARAAAEDGMAGIWLSQIFGPDALTTLAVVGQELTELELGVSVVPIYGRHPFVLATQARTVHAAVDGRLVLGIGPSHQIVVEGLYGESYARPYTHTMEHLEALLPLLAGEAVDLVGEELTARGKLEIEAPGAPPVLVAALGPRMLRLAGTAAAGTTLWMVGPKTISSRIVPVISEAAAGAGRPAPRIVAGTSVCVTDDPSAARARAASVQAMYGSLPAYQAMLQAEGVDGPEGLMIAGTEAEVADGLQRYISAGATDLRVTILQGSDAELDRTRALLRTLV
jgi:F420-dependent oxidoreductase-like protein